MRLLQGGRQVSRGTPARLVAAGIGTGLAGLVIDASGHAGESGFVLLLPTHLFMIGGALAVAASFVVAIGVWRRPRTAPEGVLTLDAGPAPPHGRWAGLVTLALMAALVGAGFFGSRDPLANPLPLAVWSGWWVGLTVLHALLGNLWAWLTPWPTLYRIVCRVATTGTARSGRVWRYPDRLGHWPAVAGLLGYVWFELVYPSPRDPEHLAWAVLAYSAVTLAGMRLFGPEPWLGRAEAFTVFFSLVSWLAPFDPTGRGGPRWNWPAARLLRVQPLPVSGVFFVLLALASVSFDGLSKTFWWLALVGVNPLEYPGRTALVGINTTGLLATFAVFVGAYALVILAARGLGGEPAQGGRLVVSIVPIAFGYHFAHYLPSFLVNVQYLVKALSDPFALGWNLLGASGMPVTVSFLTHHHSVAQIWYCQVAIIVVAHICAVGVAHVLTLQAAGVRRTVRSQLPLTVLMVFYTVFGLWLLSAPTTG